VLKVVDIAGEKDLTKQHVAKYRCT